MLKIRFINLAESLDQNSSWETAKKVRTDFLNRDNNLPCQYLLTNEEIKENIRSFINLENETFPHQEKANPGFLTSSTTPSYIQYHIPKNLSRDVINNGAKMFLYLNSCHKPQLRTDIYFYFYQVFKKTWFEPTNSGIFLYTLNAMKLFPNDERIIASKILEKVVTQLKLSFVQSQRVFLSKKAIIGMNSFMYNTYENFCIVTLDGKMYPKSSKHPVHILDKDGNISPSSFIPFCSFGNDMKNMGREVNGFNDPV